MAKLNIKSADCLIVTITPWTANAALRSFAGGFDINGQFGLGDSIVLQGVFDEEGAFATLEAPTEEDEYRFTADGTVCVYTRQRNVEILTLRLASCNAIVDDLVSLKNGVSGPLGQRIQVPWQVVVYDACQNYTLYSQCAFMVSNPIKSFGNDDTATEIKIVMTDIHDDNVALTNERFDQIVDQNLTSINGVNGVINV